MPHANEIRIGNRVLDLVGLPEAARQELLTFYDFLMFKYQKRADSSFPDKKSVLSGIFEEADGALPEDYSFDREALHERESVVIVLAVFQFGWEVFLGSNGEKDNG